MAQIQNGYGRLASSECLRPKVRSNSFRNHAHLTFQKSQPAFELQLQPVVPRARRSHLSVSRAAVSVTKDSLKEATHAAEQAGAPLQSSIRRTAIDRTEKARNLILGIVIVVQVSGLHADSLPGQTELSLKKDAPFVLYLRNPPWIKRIRYVESQYHEAGATPDNIKVRGWVNMTNVLAIQPSGMFFESLNPNPVPFAVPPSPKQRVVEGVSDKQIWQGNRDSAQFSFSSLRSEEGWAANNRLQLLLNVRSNSDVDPVRYFGLPALRPATFVLAESGRFEALASDGSRIRGQITDVDDNLPTKLEYSVGEDPRHYFVVTYAYGPGEDLPNYIERSEFYDKQPRGLSLTNWIEEASYGIDASIEHGFGPELFFDMRSFKTTLMESNGRRYRIMSSGGLQPISEVFTPSEFRTRKYGIPVLAVILLLNLIFGLFLWRTVRARRQT